MWWADSIRCCFERDQMHFYSSSWVNPRSMWWYFHHLNCILLAIVMVISGYCEFLLNGERHDISQVAKLSLESRTTVLATWMWFPATAKSRYLSRIIRASTFVGGEKSFAFKLGLNFSKLVPGNHESSRRIVGLLKISLNSRVGLSWASTDFLT